VLSERRRNSPSSVFPFIPRPPIAWGKDNSGGGDGVRNTVFTMDLIYQEVRDLAKIFNVQERGEDVVADLKKREEAARAKIASVNGKLSAVFWFSSAELDIDPYVAGRKGAPGYIMSALGLKNVIESDEEWPNRRLGNHRQGQSDRDRRRQDGPSPFPR
jgi:iron complex transport system substrate-binding protein